MLKTIDTFLDKITMYRLLVYYLLGLLGVGLALSAAGDLQYNPWSIIASASILAATCWTVNKTFAYVFDVPANRESWLITALILALIITPQFGLYNITFLLAAAGLAMASKYLLTVNDSNVFNPAALAVALTAFGPQQTASWWVGTGAMLPFVLIGGVLLMRKIRRGHMVLTFLATTLLATIVYTLVGSGNIATALKQGIESSPIFFLGFVMLTEPVTSPGTVAKQRWYGALVGLLLPPQVHLMHLYSSPELSLLVGNVFSYWIDRKVRLRLAFKEKLRITTSSVDFVFASPKQLAYQPGQYMEFTLPHHGADDRGNRRYFTLASSPTESDIRLGVKFHQPSSSYKKAMLAMRSDTPMLAAQVAGDFTLPKDTTRKLAFIAGGIGITPFRSMIKYLVDTKQKRDIVLLYAASKPQELAYKEVFEMARRQLDIKVMYVVTDLDGDTLSDHLRTGRIDGDLIQRFVPDYRERTFYLSGSHSMVTATQQQLAQLAVPRKHIKTDYFPGYA